MLCMYMITFEYIYIYEDTYVYMYIYTYRYAGGNPRGLWPCVLCMYMHDYICVYVKLTSYVHIHVKLTTYVYICICIHAGTLEEIQKKKGNLFWLRRLCAIDIYTWLHLYLCKYDNICIHMCVCIHAGTLEEIQVGCGPCGELRYPSYPLSPRPQWPQAFFCF